MQYTSRNVIRKTNLLAVDEWFARILGSHKPADMVFVDFVRAFDSVYHLFLLTKRLAFGIHGKIVSWITVYFDSNSSRVRSTCSSQIIAAVCGALKVLVLVVFSVPIF